MSVFDYPRFNFYGTMLVNPGTANNDDYAPQFNMTDKWGPFAGQPFGLVDSKVVRARTFGMSDDAFIRWVQQPQDFVDTQAKDPKNPLRKLMPAEWNYYGDMSTSVQAAIIGVETGPGKLFTKPEHASRESALIGEALTFSGGITDVNSEGSPPATQFFIDQLKLMYGDQVAAQGRPSKGASQWLNFYRNVNRGGDSGGGAYVYHVLLNGDGNVVNIPGIPTKGRGMVIRYYLYSVTHGTDKLDEQAALYKQQKKNPATLQVVGTIAPLRDDERILTAPVGRLMIANTPTIKTPAGTTNNAGPTGLIELAPAVLQQSGNRLSADFLGTFPDYFKDKANNPKFDFGEVDLAVTGGGKTVTIGKVPYTDTDGGNQRGWVFDFDVSSNSAAQQALKDPAASFSLVNKTYGTVLDETPYYFVSNQLAVYAEQHGPGDRFLNQGTFERATVAVYHRGRLMPREGCVITVWAYQSTPIQAPGNAVALNSNFRSGDPLVVDTSQPGNVLLTFTINDNVNPAPGGYPPLNYTTFSGPPWVTNAPQISVRILPNDEDFSRYYIDPCAEEPVGNERLTFQVVYEKVLRTYYLLFPAMNLIFPLNSEAAVTKMAKGILARTDLSLWMTTSYMPRTRDMSASRKKLLRAWCRKVTGT